MKFGVKPEEWEPFESPSLRGSGLKLTVATPLAAAAVSLFTREWIEMDAMKKAWAEVKSLPLYEGVD